MNFTLHVLTHNVGRMLQHYPDKFKYAFAYYLLESCKDIEQAAVVRDAMDAMDVIDLFNTRRFLKETEQTEGQVLANLRNTVAVIGNLFGWSEEICQASAMEVINTTAWLREDLLQDMKAAANS